MSQLLVQYSLLKNFHKKLSYADDLRGKTQSQDHDISTDPSLPNTFWAVFQTCIYLYLVLQVEIFDRIFLNRVEKFVSLIPWTSSLAKTVQ